MKYILNTKILNKIGFICYKSLSCCSKIYWTDQGYGQVPTKIGRCNMDGSEPENIVTSGLSQLQHIALDIPAGRIYWTQQNPGAVRCVKSTLN